MKPAAKFALQFMLLGMVVFALTIVGSAMGWLRYCPDPFQLPDGGMKEIFRAEDAGVSLDSDAGAHDVTPWLESESLDSGVADSGILIQDSERHERKSEPGDSAPGTP